MNARDDADYYLTFSGHGPAKRAALLDAHAAEATAAAYRAAADEIRAEADSLNIPGSPASPDVIRCMTHAADHLRARADQMGQQ